MILGAKVGQVLGYPGAEARAGEPGDVLEAAADAGERADDTVGLSVVPRLRPRSESRFADEARWREALGLGARRDVGELLGVEPKEFGGGAAATGGYGRSEVAGRWNADPSTRE